MGECEGCGRVCGGWGCEGCWRLCGEWECVEHGRV